MESISVAFDNRSVMDFYHSLNSLQHCLESISCHSSQIWNTLPNNLKLLPSVHSFKFNKHQALRWLKLHLQGLHIVSSLYIFEKFLFKLVLIRSSGNYQIRNTPQNNLQLPSVSSFKTNIKDWDDPNCTCRVCTQ